MVRESECGGQKYNDALRGWDGACQCRAFNAAGVVFQSPGLASGSEDPGGQPWVSGPSFSERCRRSIPSGVSSFPSWSLGTRGIEYEYEYRFAEYEYEQSAESEADA